MIVTHEFALGILIEQFAEQLLPTFESTGFHPLGRTNGSCRFVGIGKVHRTELGAEEAPLSKRLDLFVLTNPFQPLPDIDEGRHDRVAWPENS